MRARFIRVVPRILFGAFILIFGISDISPVFSDSISLGKVKVTQWSDPSTRPTSYEEWREKQTILPLWIKKRYSTSLSRFLTVSSQKFYILVNSRVYNNIENSLNQYVSDVENEGYSVVVYSGTFDSPQSLRTYLRNGLSEGLVGCLLVGDFPVPWYEMDNDFDDVHSEFPCDLYYMDLDGNWEDSDNDEKFDTHTNGTGDVGPEIWLGRLTASTLTWGNEVSLLQNHFRKVHTYRTGELSLSNRALAYIDDHWVDNTGYIVASLSSIYDDPVVVNDKATTNPDDYKQRLVQDYEWIHIMSHGTPSHHLFYIDDEPDGRVWNSDVKSIDPHAFFFNLFTCSSCRYIENNYLGGWYTFADTYGLATIGSTKTGSMWPLDDFYRPLGEGKNLGQAFKEWFEGRALGGFDLDETRWCYGMTLLGDPILKVKVAANNPPHTPPAPTGPDSGNSDTPHYFAAATFDPDGDQVCYKFDWGDGTQSNWTDFVNSGEAAGEYHSWSGEGTYGVKVKAKDPNDAESGWSDPHTIVISKANQPPNTPSDPSPADGATDQSIDVDLSWSGGDPDSGDNVTYDVYFKANDSNFGEPISRGQSETTYDPGTLSYETHYYWKIVATDNHGASAEGPVWNFTTGSSGRHENEIFSLPAGKWKMISIPFTLDDPSLNVVLVDDLGQQNDAVWKLYRWNTANGSYDKYPYVGDFAPGKAFWFISKDAKTVDTGPGTDVSRQTDFVINLTSGWSQIGNPFPFYVDWGEVMVRKDSEVVSISEAQARGWVRDKIWSWDGDSYIYYPAPGGRLVPYEGHWVRALLDCELLVPPNQAQQTKAFEQVVNPEEEFLQLKAKVSDLEDNFNFLGFSEAAKDDYDRLDVEEAPPISPYISLFFPHLEWGKNKGDYTQDIRGMSSHAGLKRIWDFQVKTDQINQEIVLEWENTSAFSEDLHLYLTDSFSNVLANMREKSSYGFVSSSGLESFKVIATSEALALPEDLDLAQVYGYPNPAHGKGARFHFHLASSAKLTIKIYSISGELVRTLIKDEVYFPGAYEEFWKEDNDRRERLARGVYIFIIQAGNPAKAISKSGKIVLLD